MHFLGLGHVLVSGNPSAASFVPGEREEDGDVLELRVLPLQEADPRQQRVPGAGAGGAAGLQGRKEEGGRHKGIAGAAGASLGNEITIWKRRLSKRAAKEL